MERVVAAYQANPRDHELEYTQQVPSYSHLAKIMGKMAPHIWTRTCATTVDGFTDDGLRLTAPVSNFLAPGPYDWESAVAKERLDYTRVGTGKLRLARETPMSIPVDPVVTRLRHKRRVSFAHEGWVVECTIASQQDVGVGDSSGTSDSSTSSSSTSAPLTYELELEIPPYATPDDARATIAKLTKLLK